MTQIRKLSVTGFKSIKALEDFELNALNVLIGANGANDYFNVDRKSGQSTTKSDK